MPKVPETYLEARRQEILHAADVCFARNGFHQTTIQDICHLAEMSPGAVYRYFASKEDIIEASCFQRQQRHVALIKEARQQDATLRVIDELAGAFFSSLEEPGVKDDIGLNVQLWGEALRSPPIMAICRQGLGEIRAQLTEIVLEAQQRGDVDPALRADAVARVLISFFDGLVRQMAADPEIDVPAYVAAARAMMAGTFWRGESREDGEGVADPQVSGAEPRGTSTVQASVTTKSRRS